MVCCAFQNALKLFSLNWFGKLRLWVNSSVAYHFMHQLTAPSCLLFSVILELELESSSADILFGDSVSLFHVLILLLDVFSLQ